MTTPPPKQLAPFTADQVKSINAYQVSGVFHQFTCENESCRDDLVAQEEHLKCPTCGSTQDWVHAWMADWGWEKMRIKL